MTDPIYYECACGNVYDTAVEAETCCAEPAPEWDDVCGDHDRYEDDGSRYADPRDFLRGYED